MATASATVLHRLAHFSYRALPKLALSIWAALSLLISTSLAGGHWYSLPKPERAAPQLSQALARLRAPGERGWFDVHALYTHCRCSERIVRHLLERRPLGALHEHVLLIGPQSDQADPLRALGYRVHSVSALQLKQTFGISAVPLLMIADPRGRLHYAGGYTARKQGPEILDRSIIRDTLNARQPVELPVFGCAVSRELQKLLDPLALKYQ